MSKRVSLSTRRNVDRKGVDVLFEDSGEKTVSLAVPETKSTEPQKQELVKITLYVRPDQVAALEEIQLAIRKSTGQKAKKNDLVQEAFDLLIEKHSKL